MAEFDDEPDKIADSERTVFMPAPPGHAGRGAALPDSAQTPPAPSPPAPSPPAPSPPSDSPAARTTPPPAPSSGSGSGRTSGRVGVGDVLNHIYEVRRFLARGGMGEVFEGVNVNTDERVAIKVILSHLAEDPNVQAMFRKEARTLTRLHHPALVQYRVLAQEPTLGVFYIVTDLIDGGSLGDSLGKLQPSEAQLAQLTRRLAGGLEAAHELGAIHRDMAPDNVLLPGGRLDQAQIIDFGIAKDLDPTNRTIVGDGFAGKMGFVAPEQFGDFGREIGPWTDIYSLALVILAVAAGRPADMGATLVDAIDKRRAGPDLSALPERLRPVFKRMLAPNPTDRFRTMAEVIRALDEAAGAAPSPSVTSAPAPKTRPASMPSSKTPMIAGGAVGALAIAVVAGWLLSRHPKPVATASTQVAAAASAPAAEQVRRAVEAALPSIACTWIDIDEAVDGPQGVSLRLSGVAGDPAQAQATLAKAARAAGPKLALLDASNVFPVEARTCAPLDGFRAFRQSTSDTGRRFLTQQANWELMAKNPPCVGPNAKAVVDLNLGAPGTNFTLLGMESSGALQQLYRDRSEFDQYRVKQPDFITTTGSDTYRTTICNDKPGLMGQLLITGGGPFDLALPNAAEPVGKQVDAAWLQRFAALAKAGGWRTEMVWYRVVNDSPG